METQKNKWVFSAVLKLLARRPRTQKEITDWLNRREIREEAQTDVLMRLSELKLLNDYEFACSFIRTRNLVKPRSKRVLKLELQRKGVSKEDIAQALDSVEVDESALAKELLRKNEWKWKGLTEKQKLQKQREFLMRKGFNWNVLAK